MGIQNHYRKGTQSLMAIYQPEGARYNSFQEFMAFSRRDDNHVSTPNLFSVRFGTPRCLTQTFGEVSSDKLTVQGDLDLLLDYYADSVQLPSKQITTGQAQVVGSPFKYATNTAFSQINITFKMPRSGYTRTFFERWTQLMASDSEQYTQYYGDYVCPELKIYKWERGDGGLAISDPKMLRALREGGNNLFARKYKLTACYKLENVFPYNIGSIRLDNTASKVTSQQIGFYYERYRYYTANKFDDAGRKRSSTVPSTTDSNTDESTSRNDEFVFPMTGSGILNDTASTLFSGFVPSLNNIG